MPIFFDFASQNQKKWASIQNVFGSASRAKGSFEIATTSARNSARQEHFETAPSRNALTKAILIVSKGF
jgi:hypothetical protein